MTKTAVARATRYPSSRRSCWKGEISAAAFRDLAASPNRVLGPGTHGQRHGVAGLAHSPAEERVAGFRRGSPFRLTRLFDDAVWFACQRSLIGGESVGFQHKGVSGDDVADANAEDIAGHHSLRVDGHESSIPLDLRLQRHGLSQRFGRALGAAFLHRIQRYRHAKYDKYDQGARLIACSRRHQRCGDQDQAHGLEQPAADRDDQSGFPHLRVGVAAVFCQARNCVRGGQARDPTVQGRRGFRQTARPKWLSSHVST